MKSGRLGAMIGIAIPDVTDTDFTVGVREGQLDGSNLFSLLMKSPQQ